jgi:DNA-binding transcriptional regulator YiaG
MKTSHRVIDFLVNIPNDEGDGVLCQIPIKVPVEIDPDTGEELINDEGNELIEATRARHMGLITQDEIKVLRIRLGLSQREISELLRCGEKSYTRWENGNGRPSQLVNLILCALRDGELSLDYLRSRRPNPERGRRKIGNRLPRRKARARVCA